MAEVTIYRYDGDNLEDDEVCVAEFDSNDEARDHFDRAKRGFGVEKGEYLVDLTLETPEGGPDLVDSFDMDDLMGATGRTLAEWRGLVPFMSPDDR